MGKQVKNETASQIKSLVLPFTAVIVIPAPILALTDDFNLGWGLGLSVDILIGIVGFMIIIVGLYLLIYTIRLFSTIGKGTLAPWSPPQKLVVAGPYRYVRHPMISGVLLVILGESTIFGSLVIFSWFALFFVVNVVYFRLSEEPGLVKRFGEDYTHYKNNVPSWIPRLRPWNDDRSGE